MAKWTMTSKHEFEFLGALPRYVSTLFAFVLGVGMAGGGLWLILSGTSAEIVEHSISAWIFGILGLLLGGVIAYFAATLWPWRRVSWVRTYEEGIRWKTGGREYKKRWEEVKSVSRVEMQTVDVHGQRSEWGRTSDLHLRFDDDSTIDFDQALSDHGKLARIAQEAVAARHLPGAAEELDGDGKLFGALRLSRSGAAQFGTFFTWKKLRWLAVENGHLVAHPEATKWEPLPLAVVENYAVALTLLGDMGRLRG